MGPSARPPAEDGELLCFCHTSSTRLPPHGAPCPRGCLGPSPDTCHAVTLLPRCPPSGSRGRPTDSHRAMLRWRQDPLGTSVRRPRRSPPRAAGPDALAREISSGEPGGAPCALSHQPLYEPDQGRQLFPVTAQTAGLSEPTVSATPSNSEPPPAHSCVWPRSHVDPDMGTAQSFDATNTVLLIFPQSLRKVIIILCPRANTKTRGGLYFAHRPLSVDPRPRASG